MSDAGGRVVVVGSVNIDTVVRVEEFAAAGETAIGSQIEQHLGGKGANQAMAAARAGAALTEFVGSIGAPSGGGFVRSQLQHPNLALRLRQVENMPTGQAFVTVDRNGENEIIVLPGANAHIDKDAVVDAVRDAAVVLVQLEVDEETVRAVLAAAPATSIRILNAAPMQAWATSILADVDVLVVNEGEGKALAACSDRDEALGELANKVEAVVMTLGGEGAAIALDGHKLSTPAIRAEVVDTTAAGDTFCGVLVLQPQHR